MNTPSSSSWLKPTRNPPNRTHSSAAACGGFYKVNYTTRCNCSDVGERILPQGTRGRFYRATGHLREVGRGRSEDLRRGENVSTFQRETIPRPWLYQSRYR